jgi:hypothetical protein
MSSSGDEFDDDDFEDDALWNFGQRHIQHPEQSPIPVSAPQANLAPEAEQLPWKRSRQGDAAPPSTAAEVSSAPWKRSRQGDAAPPSTPAEASSARWKRSEGRPFAGDVAIAELRKRGFGPTQLADFPAPPSGRKYRTAFWLTGVPIVVAIGIAGYELGSGQLPQPAPHSNQFDQAGLVSGESQSSDVSVKLTASADATISEPHEFDKRAIATKLKLGVELMRYGEVTKARVMFQRVADAGEGAGAFALAETYDPLVLEELRLRKGIMPDLALAHSWYERARDLGSPDARDRISRLARLPR